MPIAAYMQIPLVRHRVEDHSGVFSLGRKFANSNLTNKPLGSLEYLLHWDSPASLQTNRAHSPTCIVVCNRCVSGLICSISELMCSSLCWQRGQTSGYGRRWRKKSPTAALGAEANLTSSTSLQHECSSTVQRPGCIFRCMYHRKCHL